MRGRHLYHLFLDFYNPQSKSITKKCNIHKGVCRLYNKSQEPSVGASCRWRNIQIDRRRWSSVHIKSHYCLKNLKSLLVSRALIPGLIFGHCCIVSSSKPEIEEKIVNNEIVPAYHRQIKQTDVIPTLPTGCWARRARKYYLLNCQVGDRSWRKQATIVPRLFHERWGNCRILSIGIGCLKNTSRKIYLLTLKRG